MNKNKREASVQRTITMGNAIRRDGRERQVEIIDDEDDEIEEISKQRTSAVSDRASRLITRRQRRDAARDMQFSSDDPGEEDWDQLQEVILLSKLEAEKQEERRKMCGTLQDVMSLQVEIEPLSPVVLKDVSAETTQNNKNKEEDEIEVTASPDLFSSSHEDQEQLPSATDGGNIDSDKELPSSPPLPVTTRSPETDERDCDRSVTQSTDQRQENARKKPKLRRTRKEIRDIKEQNEDVVDFEPKATTVKINEEVQSRTSMNEDDVVHGEKRKLQELDDSNSDTDDEDIPMKRKRMSLKRKKVLVFEKGRDTEDGEIQTTKRIHDCADDPQPKSVSVVEEEATSNNRSTPKGDETSADTRQPRMSPSLLHARLSRKYAKARSRPRTVKEAMKANLYFAPRGFNISAYTTLIIRMFEKYKQRLNAAQCKARTRLPWGLPVVCGKSQGKTLDAQLPGKTSTGAAAKSSVFVWGTARIDRETQLDPDVSNRRRTLRSSTTDLPNQTAEASTPTSERSRRMPPSCEVDSESDDEGLMTSYLDKMMASSAGAGPSKKTQQSLKNNDSSEEGFVETCEQTTEAPEETSEPKQTLTSSRVGVKNNDRSPECRISADAFTQKDQALFGVGVVLDSGGSKSLWNEWDASSQQLQSEVQGMKESKTGRNESQDENSTNSAEACGEASNEMHSSQSDVIQPPKRRTSLRPLDDDSTDDESNLSQPVFSLNLPRQESLTASQESLENKTNSESKPRDKNKDILEKNVAVDSQSVLTQSESQGILGKSVLETMATDGDILYSSQALTDTQASSHKLVTETSGRGGTAGLASSVLRPTAWTGREVCPADEEFAIDLDSDESQNDRLKRSEAAEKAAAAAIKRQQGRRGNGNDDFCEASSSSSTINKSQQPENVECPLCYNCFSASEIEAHASDCQGLSSSTQASSSRIPTTGRSVTSSPSRPKPKLKNLKVVLERSPFVKDKLLERATQQIDLARRNLDFNSSGKPDRNVPSLASSSRSLNQGSRTRGGKEGAVLRSDSGSETTGYQLQNDVEGSSGHSWLDPRSPQAKKPPRTYGGNPSKPLGDDLLSLNTAKGSDTDELFTTTKHFKRLVTKRAPPRTDEIESNSDSSSEDALMTQYGAERISSRRKTRTKEAKTANTDNNEQALEKLGSSFRKRPLSLSKSQSKAKKARHRNSDSGSDEDSDDFTIVCHFCSKKIPKEIYDKHAEEELEQRKRGKTLAEPTREVIIVNEKDDQDRILDQKRVHRRRKAHEDTPTSQSSETEQRDTDQNEHEIDWDAVSNSPIKCFQFTGNSTSSVDFENQFAHLKESKDGGRRGNSGRSGFRGGRFNTRGEFSRSGSRGDYGEFSNRGQYRGSYKKVYGRGRGKNYGRKFRGYRKKK